MTPLGKLALIGFGVLLVVGLMAGLTRDFYSRDADRIYVIVTAITPAGNDFKSPTPRLTKIEGKTVDGRTIEITSGLRPGFAPGDRIAVAVRVTPWGQTWYALPEKTN